MKKMYLSLFYMQELDGICLDHPIKTLFWCYSTKLEATTFNVHVII